MASSWLGNSYRIFTDAYVVRWLKHSIEDAWLTGGVSEDSLGILYGIFEGFCRERRLSFLFLWDYSEDIEINICDLVGLKGFFFWKLVYLSICLFTCLTIFFRRLGVGGVLGKLDDSVDPFGQRWKFTGSILTSLPHGWSPEGTHLERIQKESASRDASDVTRDEPTLKRGCVSIMMAVLKTEVMITVTGRMMAW